MAAINIDITRRIPVIWDGGKVANIRRENAPDDDKADHIRGV